MGLYLLVLSPDQWNLIPYEYRVDITRAFALNDKWRFIFWREMRLIPTDAPPDRFTKPYASEIHPNATHNFLRSCTTLHNYRHTSCPMGIVNEQNEDVKCDKHVQKQKVQTFVTHELLPWVDVTHGEYPSGEPHRGEAFYGEALQVDTIPAGYTLQSGKISDISALQGHLANPKSKFGGIPLTEIMAQEIGIIHHLTETKYLNPIMRNGLKGLSRDGVMCSIVHPNNKGSTKGLQRFRSANTDLLITLNAQSIWDDCLQQGHSPDDLDWPMRYFPSGIVQINTTIQVDDHAVSMDIFPPEVVIPIFQQIPWYTLQQNMLANTHMGEKSTVNVDAEMTGKIDPYDLTDTSIEYKKNPWINGTTIHGAQRPIPVCRLRYNQELADKRYHNNEFKLSDDGRQVTVPRDKLATRFDPEYAIRLYDQRLVEAKPTCCLTEWHEYHNTVKINETVKAWLDTFTVTIKKGLQYPCPNPRCNKSLGGGFTMCLPCGSATGYQTKNGGYVPVAGKILEMAAISAGLTISPIIHDIADTEEELKERRQSGLRRKIPQESASSSSQAAPLPVADTAVVPTTVKTEATPSSPPPPTVASPLTAPAAAPPVETPAPEQPQERQAPGPKPLPKAMPVARRSKTAQAKSEVIPPPMLTRDSMIPVRTTTMYSDESIVAPHIEASYTLSDINQLKGRRKPFRQILTNWISTQFVRQHTILHGLQPQDQTIGQAQHGLFPYGTVAIARGYALLPHYFVGDALPKKHWPSQQEYLNQLNPTISCVIRHLCQFLDSDGKEILDEPDIHEALKGLRANFENLVERICHEQLGFTPSGRYEQFSDELNAITSHRYCILHLLPKFTSPILHSSEKADSSETRIVTYEESPASLMQQSTAARRAGQRPTPSAAGEERPAPKRRPPRR